LSLLPQFRPALLCLLLVAGRVMAQQPGEIHPDSVANIVAQSNNPLAPLSGVNVNEYYASSLYGSDAVANTLNLQTVLIPRQRHFKLYHLLRTTLPVLTVPDGQGSYASGLGDLVIQDAFRFSKDGAKTEWGVGPLLVLPTATADQLGAGKWQAGAAIIVVRTLAGGSVVGFDATWQASFAGSDDRPNTNQATFQPTIALAIGRSGFYISSSPIWVLDFQNDQYLIPFSLGAGKVFMAGKTIVNVTMEPQVTVYHWGEGLPAFQLFLGLSLQRRKTPK